ncbi:GNAT family protein [Paenibacillus sp. FSL R7-0048]|jgi:ribosomal-protein-alanine N-acetyltransferase|uniref:GNAT family N-acetyltransferase n=1 Tax=Paenibacillus odorifer TaxID=189426 RepID=A0ABX3GGR6_9BACL|nr:GNAT family protein [Paenibacillus odorifer]OMC62662.1 GNAT family N-acetyltransferase [Paenibacillus odorifer]OMC64985.1 GNAT family N-acetyltransferase [Paenibacillus odorifer]OMD19409.1 GNAT family N-acetyltransferase [Paenibacillus odorifer]OMD52602.1 GNAT family N-acetyltransferase [Paenibacillus odorifer]OMD62159.1 GNAT family N-acetyltransferase [Paenibacillus odorifer]
MTLTLYHTSQGIYISPLELKDAQSLLELRLNNRVTHEPFEPKRDEHFFTLESQQQIINQRIEDALQDRAYMFGIYLLDGQLIGQITLSNVSRGVAQYADLGYLMDHRMQGQGYMTAAVGLVLGYAFRALGLHRVQAAILLHNEASRRVLEKSGFKPEGVARQYLKINGQWQDHQTYAILTEDVLTEEQK